jgi:hypothetical protein
MTVSPKPGAPGAADVEMAELQFELGEESVAFTLSESLYPLDAVYRAAYQFVDRCFVYLGRPAPQEVKVHLRAKDSRRCDL